MSRQFNGTDQALQSAAVLNFGSTPTITTAFWLYWDAYVDDDDQVMEHGTNAFSYSFAINPNSTGVLSRIFFRLGDADGNEEGSMSRVAPSAGAWHHWIVEWDRAALTGVFGIKCWIDNVSQSFTVITPVDQTHNFPNDGLLNLFSRNAVSNFGAGRMYALAIYSGVLSAQNRTDLQTQAPHKIGKTPLHYWPLEGVLSPEPAVVGGTALTLIGTPTQAANPLTFAQAFEVIGRSVLDYD